MKSWIKYIVITLISVLFIGVFSSCVPEEQKPVKLTTPTGLTLFEKEVTWREVDGAKLYAVVINERGEKVVNYNFYQIEDYPEGKDFTIKVKAIGDGERYADSDWAEYTYVYVAPNNTNLTYTLLSDGSGYEVGKKDSDPNKGLKGRVVIPDFYNGLPIKKIADDAFYLRSTASNTATGEWCNISTTSVRLPAYLETIGKNAFRNCIALEEINIPEYVSRIEERAFFNCKKISGIELPDRLVELGERALSGMCIKEVTIPAQVSRIENNLFLSCKELKKVILSEGVMTIGKYAFSSCNNLEEITLPDSLKEIEANAFRGCDSLTGVFIPAGVKSIATAPFQECMAMKKGITVAEDNENYYSIDGNLYSREGVLIQYVPKEGETILEIPEGTTAIGAYACYKCDNLIEVKIPEDVTIIEENAFSRCANLDKVTMAEGVISIGEAAFYYSKLSKLVLSNTLVTIEGRAFWDCNLEEVTIPDSVERIGENAFFNNKMLTNISFGANAYFGNMTICGSSENLKNITVSDDNEYYCTIDGDLYTKDGTVLLQYATGKEGTFFKIPESVKEIGANSFGGHHLTGVVIPKSVTSTKGFVFGDSEKINVYYCITQEEYKEGNNIPVSLIGGIGYFYSETPPTYAYQNFWCYDENAMPLIWEQAE